MISYLYFPHINITVLVHYNLNVTLVPDMNILIQQVHSSPYKYTGALNSALSYHPGAVCLLNINFKYKTTTIQYDSRI